ncbi:MAG: hypothetical protein SGBAC_011959, partial [Bacillariaceae sp.]
MHSDHDADLASFALFTQSFDTISESGHFFREAAEADNATAPKQDCVLPPRKINLKARTSSSSSSGGGGGGGNRGAQLSYAKEDQSVGNLSPIQLGPEESTSPPPTATTIASAARPPVYYPDHH